MAGQFHKNLKQMLYFLCNPVNWKPNWISHAVQSLTQGVKQESGSASKHRLRDRRWGEGLVKQKLRPLGEITNIHRDKWSARECNLQDCPHLGELSKNNSFKRISHYFCLLTKHLKWQLKQENTYNTLFCAHAQIGAKEELLGTWKQEVWHCLRKLSSEE